MDRRRDSRGLHAASWVGVEDERKGGEGGGSPTVCVMEQFMTSTGSASVFVIKLIGGIQKNAGFLFSGVHPAVKGLAMYTVLESVSNTPT